MRRRIISARRGGAILVLLLVCLALAGLVYDELSSPENDLPKPSLPAGAVAPVSMPKAEEVVPGLPPIETLAEVTDRPLFTATRRPPPPDAVQENTGNASSFVLLGVVISKGERLAIIRHGRPPAAARLTEGQTIEGWTLQSIAPDRVVLKNADNEQSLKLRDLKEPPAGPPPAAPRSQRN